MSDRDGSNRRVNMMANDDALTHKTRSLIHELVVDRPGLTFSEIMRIVKVKESTLRYHLRYLERKEVVRTKEKRGRKAYFPSMEETRKGYEKDLSKIQLKVLDIIDKDPGLDQKTLVSRMKGNRFLISYHLKRLMDMGLIRKVRDGKRVRYHRLSREELKRKILREMIDDLIDGEIDEERYLKLKKDLEDL